jgi:DNA-binding transcriptional regulator YdaS (Cro superfamily)
MSEALLKAVAMIGSRAELAIAIGTTAEVVKSWINIGIHVPLEYAFAIQQVTQGQVIWQKISPHIAHFNFNKSCFTTLSNQSPILPQLITQVSLSRILLEPSTTGNSEEIYRLSINLKQHGLQRAICVDSENHLIFGEKRFHAFQMLHKKTIACWRLSLVGIIEGQYNVTELCKNFLWSERVAIALRIEKLLGKRQGQRSDLELVQNFAEVPPKLTAKGSSRVFLAQNLGFGNRETYVQSKKIYQGSPVLIHAVDIKHVSVSGALILTRLSHEQQNMIVSQQKNRIKPLLRFIKEGTAFDQLPLLLSEESAR